MADATTVSVVLAVYNGLPHIAAQVESIVAQTRPPSEVIVCDDGSEDGSPEVAEAICRRAGIPVRLLGPAGRLGVAANVDRGCRAAAGDVIVLADQDDVWRDEKLETLTADLLSGSALLAASDADLIDGEGRPLGSTLFERLEVDPADLESLQRAETAFATLLRRNLVTGATVAFRRSLLDLASPFPREWVHDEWLAVLAAAAGPLAVERDPMIAYRLHDSNQIGVTEPTLRAKLRAVLAPRQGRTALLATRSDLLADRLERLGSSVRPGTVGLARAKARFERERSLLPAHRLARLPRILRLVAHGGYRRFASRGLLDVARDLLQRP